MSDTFIRNGKARKSILIIVIIIFLSIIVSLFFYSYFQFVISEIDANNRAEIQKSSRIETFQLAQMLSNNLNTIVKNLYVLSNIPAIQQDEPDIAKTNINLRQESTNYLTDFYGWTDSNGNIIYSSTFENETLNQVSAGTSLNNYSLFKYPSSTHLPYVGSSYVPFDDKIRFLIVYPILEYHDRENSTDTDTSDLFSNASTFKGIVFAGIPVNKIDRLINDHISPESNIRAGLIDGSGILLQGRESSYLGKSVFGPEFQSTVFPSIIPNDEKDRYNNFINASLINAQQSKNKSAIGWKDFTLDGIPTTIAYKAIYPHDIISGGNMSKSSVEDVNYDEDYFGIADINSRMMQQYTTNSTTTTTSLNDQNNSSIDKNFLMIFTSTPHILLGSVNSLIDNMKNLGTFLIIAISVLTILSTIIILSWNSHLNQKVREKTAELKKANDELLEKESLQREFINIAAHELRTPTQAISGYIEIGDELYNEFSKNKKIEINKQEELERILTTLYNHHQSVSRNTSRLENLINNLLDVARIDSGKKDMIMLHKENFDLVREIKDIMFIQMGQKVKDKNINVNFINDFLGDSCFVYADRSRVNQILTNLIDNAIKFSKKDGNLNIIILEEKFGINLEQQNLIDDKNKLEKDQIYVAISDTGKGITSNILLNLFEKFNTDSDVGTGLGLYISKKLVEAMGGKIWAFNNKDGIGSTFVFSLPKIKNKDESISK